MQEDPAIRLKLTRGQMLDLTQLTTQSGTLYEMIVLRRGAHMSFAEMRLGWLPGAFVAVPPCVLQTDPQMPGKAPGSDSAELQVLAASCCRTRAQKRAQ